MVWPDSKQIQKRQTLFQALSLGYAISSVLVLYFGLGIICNSESPIVVVLSGSMEPAIHRGDLLFLTNSPFEQYKLGDILVYRVPGADVPIVHRVIEATDVDKSSHIGSKAVDRSVRIAGDQKVLTKGDNNPEDDVVLYNGLERLRRKHVVGKVRGFVPYVGHISLVMNDVPSLKYTLFALLGLMALIQI